MNKEFIGIVIEESLTDSRIINGFDIKKVHITNQINPSDRCHMYEVNVSKEEIEELSRNIVGKWYMHFWKGTDIIAIFRDKTFEFNYEDKKTWTEVLKYGRSVGLPKEQLDFPINIVELLCKVHFIVNFDRTKAARPLGATLVGRIAEFGGTSLRGLSLRGLSLRGLYSKKQSRLKLSKKIARS